MDRQSPTSIRYSYSNSSNTDSVGISRSLERSGNFNSGGALSNRMGTFNNVSRQNLSDLPIIQHPSQSAHSSSIPSQYMGQSSIPQIQRPPSNQHRAQHSLNFNTTSMNNNTVTSSTNNANISTLDRATYEMQIRELKILIHQQQQQLAAKTQLENSYQQLQSKYTRCIQQLSQTVEQNQQLRKQLQRVNSQMSQVGSSRNFMDTSKSNQMSRAKQQQIRRLKDSVIVLQKQKHSYQDQTNQLEIKLNLIEKQNQNYEDKLVLISHQIQRLKWLLNQKSQEKTKLTNQNQTLRNQIIQLKVELQRHDSRSGVEVAEHSQRNAQYARKLQQLYYEIEKKGREKVQVETQNRRLSAENRDKQQEYRVQLQKMRIQINVNKRQMDELQAKNVRLSDELRGLYEKNNTSQMQLSNVSTQTTKLQSIIKQLEDKLKLMEKQYNSQLQKINNFSQQNSQLKNNLKLAQQQIKRTRSQAERFEQQSIQLRRKIQQISINSQKQTINLGQNVKQKDFALHELQKRVKQLQGKNKDHQQRNRQLTEQVRVSQSKNKDHQMRGRQLVEQSKHLQGRSRQYEHKVKQSQNKLRQQERMRKQTQSKVQQQYGIVRQLQDHIRGLQLKNQTISKEVKQYESKNISLGSQYQKLQISYNNLISSKNVQQSRLRQTFTSNLGQLQSQLNTVSMYKNELNAKFEQIRQENSKLTQQLVNNRNAKMQLQTKITMLQTMIQHNKQDYAYLQQSFNSVENQLRQQINLTKQLTLKLSKQNEMQKSQYFQQIHKKQTVLFDIQQKMNESSIIMTSLHTKIQDKDHKINEQMKEIDQYRQQSLHAQQQLDSIRVDFKNLVQQLDYLKQSNISKEKAFMQAKEQINTNLLDKQAKLNEKNEELWKCQSQLAILHEKNRAIERESQMQKDNANKLQSQLTALMDRLRITQKQNRQLKQNALRGEERQRMQERETVEYKAGIQRLEQKYRQIQREFNQAVEATNRLEQRNRTLERQYSSNTASMNERHKILEREYNEVKANAGRLEERCRHWELQFRQLQSRYNELDMDKSQVDDKYKQTDSRYRQLQLQNRQLEHQCRHTQQQVRQIQSQFNLCRVQSERVCEQNRQLEQEVGRSQQSQSVLQQRYRKCEQQCSKYKQSLGLMSTKYRTLQVQHNELKQSLHSLQQRYAQIQKRSSILEQQLNVLQKQYMQMIQVHKLSEQELLQVRQVVKKTEQERYFMQEQKQQQAEYYTSQLRARDQAIQQLQAHIQAKNRQIQALRMQSASSKNKVQSLQSESVQSIQRYEDKISTLATELQHIIKQKQTELSQYQANLINTKQQYMQYKLQAQQQMHTLTRQMQMKQESRREVEHTCNIYADKIHKLTHEIGELTNKMNSSRYAQEREIETVMQAKNTRIQELERDIINRQQHYRQEVIKMQNANAANVQQELSLLKSQHSLKVSQLQHINNTLQTQLLSQEQKYKELTLRLESILSTNDQHFQQILQYLEKILQINTELIISVSKTNSTIINVGNTSINAIEDMGRTSVGQMGAFRAETMGVLTEIRDKLAWESETTRTRLEDEDNRRVSKERTERKEKQDNLEREERIIRYLQQEKEKSRADKERQQRKFNQLQQKLQQNQRSYLESIQHMNKQITRTIQQELATREQQSSIALREHENSRQRQERELKEEREQRERQSQENIIRESRNNNKHLHEITGNILSKMDNLTHLFLENNEQYKNSMASMQDNITRLEHTNNSLVKQLQQYRQRQRDMVYKHSEQIQRLVHKSQSTYKEHQFASNSMNQLKQQYRSEISRLGLQLQRSSIESEEMRRQYDKIVSQYEKTNASLQEELELARRQMERQWAQHKQKEQEMHRIMTSTSNTGRNNTNSSSAGSGSAGSNDNRSSLQSIQHNQQQLIQNLNTKHNQQLSQAVQKYQNKIVLLSQEIQRLHRVIDTSKEYITKVQKQYRNNNNSYSHTSLAGISKQYESTTNRKYDNQILWLKHTIAEKDIEIKLLNTRLSAIETNNPMGSSRYQETYQLQIMELKHKLNMTQQENNALHAQIDRSVKTIQNLTHKIETIKKSYKEMADHAENIQNRVLTLYGKYNYQLINKSAYEESTNNINQTIITKMETENKLMKQRTYQIEQKYEDMKMEFNKMQTIIQGLKYDNLHLRKVNYEYELELQKVGFMKQKIGKLSSEVDRVAQQNIQLNQQVQECRFAIGDEATLDKKLFQSYLLIVLLSAEIQALRTRVLPLSRDNSRDGSLEKQKINEGGVYNERQKLSRVKSQEGPFRNLMTIERRDASRSRSKSKSKIDDLFTFERPPQKQASQGEYPKFPPLQISGFKDEIPKRVSRLITYQFQNGVAVPRTSSRHIDPNLSSLLRKSPTKQKSRNKSPKTTTYY